MAASPFLPGTNIQYAWDSTSLGWLKECPRKYFYHMIEGWRSKSESVHLKYGIWYHNALELYDKLRAGAYDGHENPEAKVYTHDEALEQVIFQCLDWTWVRDPATDYEIYTPEHQVPKIGAGRPWLSDHPNKTRETLIRSVIWYLDQFKDDPAKTIILDSGKPAVELSFRMEMDWGPEAANKGRVFNENESHNLGQPYLLCGHLDRVVDFGGGTYVMDRKTSSSTISSQYFEQYDPDNQMSLYSMAAKVIYKTPVKGVIIDAVQIAVGFSRFVRGFTYRTESQINEWLADTKEWLGLAEHFATKNFWPMNDKSCHKYGGCSFRKICSKDPSVRDRFLESDFTREPWNPLKVR